MSSLRILVRSVNGRSDSAFIRPDDIDLLIQQEVSNDDFANRWSRLFDKTECNLQLHSPFLRSKANVYIANHERGICESYKHESNHEFRNGYLTLEDGRSQRYFIETGGWFVGVSHNQADMSRLIKFNSIDDIVLTEQLLRIKTKEGAIGTFFLTIIHGKFVRSIPKTAKDLSFQAKSQIQLLKNVMKETYERVKSWSEERPNRFFAVLLARDNRLRFDVFDYFQFHKDMKKWNVPSPYVSLCDPNVDPGWWILIGHRSSKEVEIDVLQGQMGDVNPVVFTLHIPGERIDPRLERQINKDMFLERRVVDSLVLKDSFGGSSPLLALDSIGYNRSKGKKILQIPRNVLVKRDDGNNRELSKLECLSDLHRLILHL